MGGHSGMFADWRDKWMNYVLIATGEHQIRGHDAADAYDH